MAMRKTNIGFSESTWARLQAEAAKEKVTVAQYVRELAVAHFARLDARLDSQRSADQASRRHDDWRERSPE